MSGTLRFFGGHYELARLFANVAARKERASEMGRAKDWLRFQARGNCHRLLIGLSFRLNLNRSSIIVSVMHRHLVMG